jgi:hypothetical protein
MATLRTRSFSKLPFEPFGFDDNDLWVDVMPAHVDVGTPSASVADSTSQAPPAAAAPAAITPDLFWDDLGGAFAADVESESFSTQGTKWGPSSAFGTSGGTVTWSLAGSGWGNGSPESSWFSGTTVALSDFLSFDFISILTQAFAAWAGVANINFLQVADGGGAMGSGLSANIRVGAAHMDGRPTTGGSILGAAFYPASGGNPQNVGYSGDIIFDSDEGGFWNTSSFLAVATHEIGHSIGLRHTTVSGSLMQAFYNPAITSPQADDIAGARAIYGAILPITGDGGNNNLVGTSGPDTILGLGGNDTLSGLGANDTLDGGTGNDFIDGGAGDDSAVFTGSLANYALADLGVRITIAGTDGSDTLVGVEHLRFADGTIHLNDGSTLFDTAFYDRTYLDVFRAGVDARSHYGSFGRTEGRDPNAFFSTSWYLSLNSDVRASGANPLDHYHSVGWRDGRDPAPNFDTGLYLKDNPDVAASGVDPLEHYLQFGRAEGRAAYQAVGLTVAGFDGQYYLAQYADVRASGVDALQHFNTFGWREGRNPNALFDTAGYLSRYTDVQASGANPLQHYELYGWLEGRDPSAGFDTLHYIAAYPDIAAAHTNPLDHYLNNGIYEGRSPFGDGIWH